VQQVQGNKTDVCVVISLLGWQGMQSHIKIFRFWAIERN